MLSFKIEPGVIFLIEEEKQKTPPDQKQSVLFAWMEETGLCWKSLIHNKISWFQQFDKEVCLDYSCIGLHAVTQGQHKTQRKANCKHSGFLFNQTNALSVKIQEMYHIQKLL